MQLARSLWLDTDVVLHGSPNPLFTPQVAFGCLHGNVPEEEFESGPGFRRMHGTAWRRNASDHEALVG